ncbi:MAG: bifunctional diaminohydroxyphosphoribosylaminopyrimidine deaminase/5-amino-6-(5-phosphoribosylamino)uracil reductase RibD [Gemmatimonadota bacterium]
MRRALELAWRGWGQVSPNPLVGAVVLRGDEAVAEGWHAAYGRAHAELAALHAAGEKAKGATLVVTLEPCAHHGKTPPCTDAIRAAGVRRVVAAVRDPDQDARGGFDILKRAGIDTQAGLLAEEAAAQNAPFLFTRLQTHRPFVALKLATSIDGRIADAGGSSQWISGPEAREHVHWLRAGFDAIAVGGMTALMDNPQLTARGGVTPRKPPVRIVFDRRAMLNLGVSLVQTAREVPTWVVASQEAPMANVSVLEGNGVRVFRPEALSQAFAQLRLAGIQSILCEGGGALGTKLLAEGLVDRLYWVQAPVWLGEGGVAAFAGIPASPLAEAPRWTVVERRALGSDTLLVLDRRLCLPES